MWGYTNDENSDIKVFLDGLNPDELELTIKAGKIIKEVLDCVNEIKSKISGLEDVLIDELIRRIIYNIEDINIYDKILKIKEEKEQNKYTEEFRSMEDDNVPPF